MPFKSKRQMRWAFAHHKSFAAKWLRHTPNVKRLPEKAKKKKKG